MMIHYYPEHINIETSDYCNRSCHYCPIQHARGNDPPRLLDMGLYEALLRELQTAPHRLKISLQWIDEPLANPSFFEYADLGRKLLPEAQWLLQTNGDFLTDEKAERIKTTFDAVAINFYAESAHEAFLRKDLDLVTARFPHRIQSPGRLSRSRGFVGRDDEAVFHINEKYHDADWVQSFDAIQQRRRCMRLWMQVAIGYDGQVYLCCRDNLKQHPVGALHEDSLAACYNSPEAQRLRRLMEQGERQQIDMCRQCPGAYPNPFFAYPAPKRILLGHEPHDASVAHDAHAVAHAAGSCGEGQSCLGGEGRAEGSSPEPKAPVLERVSLEALKADLTARQMPFGLYDYETARETAKQLGHMALPGFLPGRYEYVVGLTRCLAEQILGTLQEVLGEALKGLWVCGSRVITRTRLRALDPAVFKDAGGSHPDGALAGTLTIGKKSHLREFGPDPRLSSDLDLKVLVDEALIDEVDAARLGKELGQALEAMSPYFPLSGHVDPLLRLLRVPSNCADAREAFAYYNAMRMAWLRKGPLSLEYVQLLYDPTAPEEGLFGDPTAAVTQRLQPVVLGTERVALSELRLPSGWDQTEGDAAFGESGDAEVAEVAEVAGEADEADEVFARRLRCRHDGLLLHQLIGALRDVSAWEPAGVVVTADGVVASGAGAVWAARQAGRSSIAVMVA